MNERDAQVDAIVAATRDGMIDKFAEFVTFLNEQKYEQAAIHADALGVALGLFAQGLAIEAVARIIANGGLDNLGE